VTTDDAMTTPVTPGAAAAPGGRPSLDAPPSGDGRHLTSEEHALFKKIHLAVCDPGAYVPREREQLGGVIEYESVTHWAARAVFVVVAERERQVREQIATAIEETVCAPPEGHDKPCPDCYRHTQMQRDARIARGGS
jgi:hypothetical protein